MGGCAKAGHAHLFSLEIFRAFYAGPGHDSLHAPVQNRSDNDDVAASQVGIDHRVACSRDKLDVAGDQGADALGPGADRDHFGVDAVLFEETLFRRYPERSMQSADGAEADSQFVGAKRQGFEETCASKYSKDPKKNFLFHGKASSEPCDPRHTDYSMHALWGIKHPSFSVCGAAACPGTGTACGP